MKLQAKVIGETRNAIRADSMRMLKITEWMYLWIQNRYACPVRRLGCRQRHTKDTVSIASQARASASCQAFSDVGARIAVVLPRERRCQVRRFEP